MRSSFNLAFAFVILTFSASTLAVDSGQRLIGTYLEEFTISTRTDPLAKKYDSWKALIRLHSDGAFESIFRFYKNNRAVSEVCETGVWGSADANSYWVQK